MKAIIDLSARQPVLPRFPSYGICILESRHSPGFQMPPSRYPFSEVMLILAGEGWVSSERVRHPVEKGNVIAVPAGSAYSYTDSPDAPLAMLCLCIAPAAEPAAAFLPILPDRFRVIRNAPFSREIAPHLRAILYEQSSGAPDGAAVVIAQTLLLLSKLSRRSGGMESDEGSREPSGSEVQLLARVRDYVDKLESTFHEAETIQTAAERLGMSPRSFTSYFRRVTGLPRHQYLQKLRLQRARYLLAETEESITSIAFACGFEDLSTFFRAFRLEEKLPPAQWRKNHRGEEPSP